MQPSLHTVMDMQANPDEGRNTTYQGGRILYRAQRGGQQDPTTKDGAGILDFPGDTEASGQASGTAAGTEGEYERGKTGTAGFLEIISRR